MANLWGLEGHLVIRLLVLMEYQALCKADVDGRGELYTEELSPDESVQSSSHSKGYGLADLTHVQADFRAIYG